MGDYVGSSKSELTCPEETRSQCSPAMESEIGGLVSKFSGMGVDGSSTEHLVQIMKAVEAAEITIKQQVEENTRLRTELQKKDQELERFKSGDSRIPGPYFEREGHIDGPYNAHQSVIYERSQEDRNTCMDNATTFSSQGTLVLHQNIMAENEDPASQNHADSRHYSEDSKINGNVKVFPGRLAAVDNAGQFASPPSISFSPSRYQREGEYNPRYSSPGQGLMPMPELNNSSSLWKQVREHEEEILQLRKHLAEYSIKEAQICNEKYVLEKRIAYMRMAFDQQQQDLVDAASKALSYRQDIIEENIRLTYALQAAQQERSTFVSSLLPLLAEYSLQPPVPDAQSIVSNLKVLFKHLQEKLVITEAKLNESQYQLAPWRSDALNHSSFPPQSPAHSIGAALTTSNNHGFELVAQSTYSQGQAPISSPSNVQTTTDWDPLGHQTHPTGLGGFATKNLEPDKLGRSSPSTSRNSSAQDASLHPVAHSDSQSTRFGEGTNHVASGNDMDDSDMVGHQNDRETSAHWFSGNSPALDDPGSSFSPYLPPVLEEPSSSFSEAAEDDPLPAIEGLQISGEAFPGHELQACGYSINGTTSCNFEWIRHLEDGSVNYIEGAKKPNYLVTADDIDCYLAIEVQPLDDRKRKGEIVKVFANEQRKITGDPEMKEQVESALYSGHASYEVSLSAGYLDIWEPAILTLKKEGFSMKCNGPRGVFTEKFLPSTVVTIPLGHPTAFSILSDGTEHLLQTKDSSSLRDTIVYIMRLFIKRAGEKRKGRKKGLFFHKWSLISDRTPCLTDTQEQNQGNTHLSKKFRIGKEKNQKIKVGVSSSQSLRLSRKTSNEAGEVPRLTSSISNLPICKINVQAAGPKVNADFQRSTRAGYEEKLNSIQPNESCPVIILSEKNPTQFRFLTD
ncbi:PREDICTED: uncharacterized protein LOC104587195 isoform X2 [Nelumbo nucifera]|uniref:Uncharacterized protein LOC104587195 isoform X2 n=1 Tax=Nelumbo nucifera TaxID=4432 RepID=A0A1U7YS15_NELNU|nr:PREDICTED: uncharacterized protein LOC104587195 isoform X2 [Nelumbo nucifera]